MQGDRDFVCELLDNVSKRIGKPYKYLAPFEHEYPHFHSDSRRIGTIPLRPSAWPLMQSSRR
jgi:hypothetical protein